ncbi:hypothetical protein WA158_002496 [Blastocystis sp. Blastoise]
MSLIDSFSCDIEEEIDREVEDYCLDHDVTVNDPDEQSLYPESFHRLLSDSSCEQLLGFSRSRCEMIIQDGIYCSIMLYLSYYTIFLAMFNFKGNRKGSLSQNKSIFLALVYIRRCCTIGELATKVHEKRNIVRTALLKGIDAIAACYVPFCTTLGCPKLSSKISEAEKQRLSEQGQSSRFIIDGRHQRIAAVSSSFAQRRKFFSHKFHSPGMSAQYIINHEGLCIYVSPSLPASNSDISMFRLNKHAIMAGLNEMLTNIGDTISSVYILADKGYHSESDPELLSLPNGVNDITFNKYRILIENYFGRMTRVFKAAREPFGLAEERFDSFNKALTHLTNLSIMDSPLRSEEYKVLQCHYDKIELMHRNKAERHKEAQRKYQQRFNASISN